MRHWITSFRIVDGTPNVERNRRACKGVGAEETGTVKTLRSKPLLQAIVALLSLIPTSAGLAGIVLGPDFLRLDPPWPADLDSHFRFLSGVFLAVGVGFYSCIRSIEAKTGRFRLLASLVFCGGLARLLSLGIAGAPSAAHLVGLGMELVVVPLLVLWQARLSSR
jgi:hypothetical protein